MELAEVARLTGIERVEVLHGHTSQETAYIQEDYPYGRSLRCRRRVWLERATKGAAKGEYRMVTQTTNPKVIGREVWNKPHASTYSYWAVLVRFPDRREDGDYLGWIGLGIDGPSPGSDIRFKVSGLYDGLSEDERKFYDAFLKMSHKLRTSSWERWAEITPAFGAYYAANAGQFPPRDNGMVLGRYMSDSEYTASCAAVLLAL